MTHLGMPISNLSFSATHTTMKVKTQIHPLVQEHKFASKRNCILQASTPVMPIDYSMGSTSGKILWEVQQHITSEVGVLVSLSCGLVKKRNSV